MNVYLEDRLALVRPRGGRGLSVPVAELLDRLQVEHGLQPRRVVLDDGEVLVLDGARHLLGGLRFSDANSMWTNRTYLEDGCAGAQELHGDVGRVDAARGQDGEARQCVGDGGHGPGCQFNGICILHLPERS